MLSICKRTLLYLKTFRLGTLVLIRAASRWWNDTDRASRSFLTKTSPSATLFNTNLTWTNQGSKPWFLGYALIEFTFEVQSIAHREHKWH